ncbi:MAG: MDR family MFS transporter [Bacillota bacterium]|nr:MDR family MFS transporter [Bacillota bacterium]
MDDLNYRQKVIIMIAVMSVMLFVALSQTIVSTALPRIIASLGGMKYFSWVFSIFLLASSVPAILIGKLSDIYGRRPFIITGMSLFMVGSFFSGLAGNIFHLIISRGVQGLGGGMILVVSFASVGDLFPPRERARWQGFLTGAFGMASIFGPALGGFIVDNADWQWVFWIFLPVGFIAFILIIRLYPRAERREPEEIDYYGTLLLTIFAISLLLAFNWGGDRYAWGAPAIIGLFGLSFLSLGTFFLVESRMKSPVIQLKLFSNRVFTVSSLVGCMLGVGFFGVLMYMPFFVQGVMGASSTMSGFVVMPMTLAMVTASAISGQIVTRTGKFKKLALTGLLVMAGGLLSISFMNQNTSLLIGAFNMMIVGIGMGIALPIFLLSIQNAVENSQLGVATATFQMARQFGGTIGVSILGIIMNFRLKSQLNQLFSKSAAVNLWEKEPETAEALLALQDPQVLIDAEKLFQIQNVLPPRFEETFMVLLELLRSALSYALFGVFIIVSAVILIAFLIGLFLEEIPLRSYK